MESKLTNDQAAAFILAGKAVFTLRSVASGVRFTYRVAKAEAQPGRPDLWFVSLLTGPDNTSSYTYLGIIRGGKFQLTAKSKLAVDSKPVAAFGWVWARIAALPATVEFWHAGRCGRCGHPLTVPESIGSGYGPECILKVAA